MASPVEPMLAIASTGASGRRPIDVRQLVETGDWVLETKMDGIRAMNDPDGQLTNRRGANITYKFPEITIPMTGHILDGEIVARDGNFETVLMRESQENRAKIHRLSESHPCIFVAFDLPRSGAYDWRTRRNVLESLRVHRVQYSHDIDFIDAVREAGGEGVIAKRIRSTYQPGKRSADWVKFKFVSHTTCIAFGYEPGNGSRAHFGALKIALIRNDSEVVDIGRIGSGFTDRQTWEMKHRLDAGEMFPVEIEHMLTAAGELRFATFRGIRQDKSLLDCTYSQLEE